MCLGWLGKSQATTNKSTPRLFAWVLNLFTLAAFFKFSRFSETEQYANTYILIHFDVCNDDACGFLLVLCVKLIRVCILCHSFELFSFHCCWLMLYQPKLVVLIILLNVFIHILTGGYYPVCTYCIFDIDYSCLFRSHPI